MGQRMTEIVAEPGSTHGGDLSAMLELVRVSADAGSTAFKNQWVSNPVELCRRRGAQAYLESYGLLGYPLDWHAEVGLMCRQLGMAYGCSVYLPGDAALVAPFVDFVKVASFEAGTSIVQDAVRTGRRVMVSTGMMTPSAVDALATKLWQHTGTSGPSHVMMLCTSAYPAPLTSLQLGVLRTWRRMRDDGLPRPQVGYSDHSKHLFVGALAVACGAEVIEAHIRLRRTPKDNADYNTAFAPDEFARYVDNIRQAEVAIGNDEDKYQQLAETDMLAYRVLEQ